VPPADFHRQLREHSIGTGIVRVDDIEQEDRGGECSDLLPVSRNAFS
jgi:hypothetical protein